MSTLPPPVEIETITLREARRQQPACFPSGSRRCTTHHPACDCREQKVAVLVKVALDAAEELDWLKNVPKVSPEQREACAQIIARIYASIDALGVAIGTSDEDGIHTRGCVCAECQPAFADVGGPYCDERN